MPEPSLSQVVSRVLRELPPEAQPKLDDIRAYFSDPNFKPNEGITLFFMILNMIALKVIEEQNALAQKGNDKMLSVDDLADAAVEVLVQVLDQAKVNPNDLQRFNNLIQIGNFRVSDKLSNSLNDQKKFDAMDEQCKKINGLIGVKDMAEDGTPDFIHGNPTKRSVKEVLTPAQGLVGYRVTQFCTYLTEAQRILARHQALTELRVIVEDILDSISEYPEYSICVKAAFLEMKHTLSNQQLNDSQKAEGVVNIFKRDGAIIKAELKPEKASRFMNIMRAIFSIFFFNLKPTPQAATGKLLTTMKNMEGQQAHLNTSESQSSGTSQSPPKSHGA